MGNNAVYINDNYVQVPTNAINLQFNTGNYRENSAYFDLDKNITMINDNTYKASGCLFKKYTLDTQTSIGSGNSLHENYSNLPNLEAAMDHDLALKMMVEEFYNLDETTLTDAILNAKFEAILFKWSGVKNVNIETLITAMINKEHRQGTINMPLL